MLPDNQNSGKGNASPAVIKGNFDMKDFLKVGTFVLGAIMILTAGVIYLHLAIINRADLGESQTNGLVIMGLIGLAGAAASIIMEYNDNPKQNAAFDMRLFLKVGSFLLGALIVLGTAGVFVQQSILNNVVLSKEQSEGLMLLGAIGLAGVVASIVMVYND